MTPERWRQVDELYHAALAQPAGQRAAFLAQACARDEALREKIESLLKAHERAGGFLDSPVWPRRFGLADQTGLKPGTQVGPYQILSLLGVGGMGEVYLAEDPRLGRKIALKLLPEESTQNLERVRRFEREARAASALNHPNILTVYEIGKIERNYFIATEFIDGQTLNMSVRWSTSCPSACSGDM
jgi:eukaryotic-like serine/threonine-protein kinase